MANWFIADSNGAGTVVLQRVDDFPILKTYDDAFAHTVKLAAPAAPSLSDKNTIPDVSSGKIIPSMRLRAPLTPSREISHLALTRSSWRVSTQLSLLLVSAAVKVAGGVSTIGQLQSLKKSTGSVAALTQLPLDYSSWQMVDVALRHSEGMPFSTDDGGLPTQLLLPGGNFAVSNSYNQPPDFAQQFRKPLARRMINDAH